MSRTCIKCGGVDFLADTTDLAVSVRPLTFHFKIPCWKCQECEQSRVEGPILVEADHRVAFRLLEFGVKNEHVFRFLRKETGLSRNNFAELIEQSVETVIKWETGTQSIPNWTMLILHSILTNKLQTVDYLNSIQRFKSAIEAGSITDPNITMPDWS